jgi:hypothetical protein
MKCKVQFHAKEMYVAMQRLVITNNITNITGDSLTLNVFQFPTNKKPLTCNVEKQQYMAKFILLMLRKPVNNGIRTIYLKKFILE